MSFNATESVFAFADRPWTFVNWNGDLKVSLDCGTGFPSSVFVSDCSGRAFFLGGLIGRVREENADRLLDSSGCSLLIRARLFEASMENSLQM